MLATKVLRGGLIIILLLLLIIIIIVVVVAVVINNMFDISIIAPAGRAWWSARPRPSIQAEPGPPHGVNWTQVIRKHQNHESNWAQVIRKHQNHGVNWTQVLRNSETYRTGAPRTQERTQENAGACAAATTPPPVSTLYGTLVYLY